MHLAATARSPRHSAFDDRELPLSLTARSADFRDVSVQGVALAERVGFTIDACLHL
jgi:hypothetical protein